MFAGQKRLKLVTHCRDNATFQQYVLLEYAAYRMYNLLTPKASARGSPTSIIGDANGRPIASQVGFFLEDLDDLAQRNGLSESPRRRYPPAEPQPAGCRPLRLVPAYDRQSRLVDARRPDGRRLLP